MRFTAHQNVEREELEALCEFHQVPWLLEELIDTGTRYSDALKIIAMNARQRLSKWEVRKMTKGIVTDSFLGMSEKEVRKFDFLRLAEGLKRRDKDFAAFELELSNEIVKRCGAPARGAYVPLDVWARDLSVGTDTAGGFTVGTDLLADQFVEALRGRLVTGRLGAQVLLDLNGDIAIPGMATGTSVYWVTENGTPTEGAPAFNQIQMTPKTVGTYIDITRKLTLQSSPSVQKIVRMDMLNALLSEIDSVAINGGGTYQPSGILQTSGIGSVALGTNGDAPTWASAANLMKEVAIDNAMVGSLAYLTNPQAVAKLRTTPKVASTDSVMLMGEGDTLMGYKVEQTTLVPSNLTKGTGSDLSAMLFGNWNDLIIAHWGSWDLMVDPYSGSSSGMIRIIGFMDVDVAVRRPESFAAIVDMVTT